MKKTTYKALVCLCIFFFAFSPQAKSFDASNYRPNLNKFISLSDSSLKDALYEDIKNQKVFSYKEARKILFGELFLEKSGSTYYVRDSYCNEKFTSSAGVGPGRIPNHNVINCEHTWPQSKFNSRMSKSAQKSDLHHLFPVKAIANSTRGNTPFAEVNGEEVEDCSASFRGEDIYTGTTSFEPPDSHKGNVARALFYFSVRYKVSIPNDEETHLRKWNQMDPVDAQERARNEKIEQIQGNRNPFIDNENLINRIEDL